MPTTVAGYIAKRLRQQEVQALFGVPAVYCAAMFDAAIAESIKAVVTSSDLEAGYAADGYARVAGLGAVSVAYGVGTLSLVNAVAGAYAERSALIVLNGGPSARHLDEFARFDLLYSHSLGRNETDLSIFKAVTALAIRLDSAANAPSRIDEAIVTAITKRRPVYVEVPSDMWRTACPDPAGTLRPTPATAAGETQLARQILQRFRAAARPAFLIGIEVQRFSLAGPVTQLLGKLGAKWATTLLAKSVIAGNTPGFVGTYDGPTAAPPVKALIENADFLVALGCELPTGYRRLVMASIDRMARAWDGKVRIGQGKRSNADLRLLVEAMNQQAVAAPAAAPYHQATPAFEAASLSHDQLFATLDGFINASAQSWIVVADTFLGIHPAADLRVKGTDAFICDSVWASIGHSVGAAVGVGLATTKRPLVICGDGGFQMTAQGLSTMVRQRIRAIVVVVANDLYGYEQYLLARGFYSNPAQPPLSYATLNPWNYADLAKAMGFTATANVETPAQLDAALRAAESHNGPAMIVARVDRRDLPAELQR